MPQTTRMRIMDSFMDPNWRQAPNIANENVESFVCILRSLVEAVALVGYEGEAAVRVVSLSPETRKKYGYAILGAGVCEVGRQDVIFKLVPKPRPILEILPLLVRSGSGRRRLNDDCMMIAWG